MNRLSELFSVNHFIVCQGKIDRYDYMTNVINILSFFKKLLS